MSRVIVGLVLLACLLVPVLAQAQGVLVVVNPDDAIRLPRPIIIWPPHPPYPPHPIPPHPRRCPSRRRPATRSTRSRSMPSWSTRWPRCRCRRRSRTRAAGRWRCQFVFPLPYDGAIDQMTLMVDGKEYPAKLLDAEGSPQALRRHRPQEPRPGPAGMDGHGAVQDERLPGAARGRSGRSRCATRSSAASKRG